MPKRGQPPRLAPAEPRLAPAAARLTRRGRVCLVLVVAVLLAVAFSVGRASTAASTQVPAGPSRHTVVRPGDTLWTIAERLAPDVDPRVTVEQLQRINRLDSPRLLVGQDLALPGP